MEVTLNLPDKLYSQAAWLAQLLNQDVPGVLSETIENALSPLGTVTPNLKPVKELSNGELLAIADLRMEATQGKRMGVLLEHQQARELSEPERNELAALIQVYHQNLVQKAQALSEAVRRGLREPLAS